MVPKYTALLLVLAALLLSGCDKAQPTEPEAQPQPDSSETPEGHPITDEYEGPVFSG